VLTSWIGSCNQVTDAQETAKNLISESLRIFESSSYAKKVLEAQSELAVCYWRESRYDEARVILKDVLSRLTIDSELKARSILRSVIVETSAARYQDALRILTEAAPLIGKINRHVIKGSYHNQLAIVLKNLASTGQNDYLDRAFIEYEAASFHFEEASNKRFLSNVENNLGNLYFTAKRFKEAHRHLDRARRLMVSLNDRVHAARVDETRARVFLSQRRNVEAEQAARASVHILDQSEHHSLAEALITHGRALARLGKYEKARVALERAIELSEEAGAVNRAGEAALALVRELGGHFKEVQALSAKLPLVEELSRYEHDLIKQALISAAGSVSNAARLLGSSHQYVAYLIEHKHQDLIPLRKPVQRRPKRKGF
jgi:tetratricopeptide (TPR) repeat protein